MFLDTKWNVNKCMGGSYGMNLCSGVPGYKMKTDFNVCNFTKTYGKYRILTKCMVNLQNDGYSCAMNVLEQMKETTVFIWNIIVNKVLYNDTALFLGFQS